MYEIISFLGVEMDSLGAFIGVRVRAFRKAHGFNQDQLAELVGCEKMTISRYERGVGTPNLDHLVKLCVALKISPAELLPADGISSSREHLPKLRDEAVKKILTIDSTDGLKDVIRLADWILNSQDINKI
ncbi:helix-turn-helix domain-containing protein [Pseudomonas savastanoi]|uniref:helix-turn-helix domain-containing protein n=1 Tax=Pseudomonas savastanoi TaxID=29438 RepID=UPI000F3D47ED|nr:helix-turn-helix transcriptional regulator [Pseudomonas savastanoi]RML91311.1 PbsX family transcriptional regulator [Pseudomonas savastanoi]RMU43384.1 PbsX family transcriptional regulator [Pseudomonas savastanoi pv. nerii]